MELSLGRLQALLIIAGSRYQPFHCSVYQGKDTWYRMLKNSNPKNGCTFPSTYLIISTFLCLYASNYLPVFLLYSDCASSVCYTYDTHTQLNSYCIQCVDFDWLVGRRESMPGQMVNMPGSRTSTELYIFWLKEFVLHQSVCVGCFASHYARVFSPLSLWELFRLWIYRGLDLESARIGSTPTLQTLD